MVAWLTAWLAGVASLFVVGAVGFWAVVILVAILVGVFEESEQEVKAFLTLVLAALFLEWVGNLGLFSFVWNHPVQLLLYVAGYFAAGVAWSLGKWWFYLDGLKEEIQRGEVKVQETHRGERKQLNKDYFQESADGKVEVNLEIHRGRILCWMTYWPWSMVWAFFTDFVRRFFRFIYNRIQGVYRKMAHWMLDNALNGPDPADRDVKDNADNTKEK